MGTAYNFEWGYLFRLDKFGENIRYVVLGQMPFLAINSRGFVLSEVTVREGAEQSDSFFYGSLGKIAAADKAFAT